MMAENAKRDSMGALPPPEEQAGHADWFEGAMLRGIRELARQPLIGRPENAPGMKAMAGAYARAAWPGKRWDRQRDDSRLDAAWALLAAGHRKRGDMDVSRFPTVADVLDALPRRKEDQPVRVADPDPETAKAGLRKVLDRLGPSAESSSDDPFERAQWARRKMGQQPFESREEYERHVTEQRALTESAQSKE